MRGETKLLLGALAIAALLPLVVGDEYVMHLLVMACFYAILASSLNIIVGYVGELPLGHTAFLGIGAYASALLSTTFGLSPIPAMLLAGVVAGLGGLVIGGLTLRLEGPYFVIVTLSFAEVLRIVANNWVGLTNGPMGIAGIPAPTLGLGAPFVGKQAFFYLALALLAATVFVLHRFVYSNQGRAAVAIRESRFVAQSIGINPFRYALIAFVLGASFAGVAGAFYAHYITFVGPDIFGFSFMVTMLIMVLIGGKGTLIGPLVGAVIITFLEEYLRAVEEIRYSIFGILVMVVVLFFPDGLVGVPQLIRQAVGRIRPVVPAPGPMARANGAEKS